MPVSVADVVTICTSPWIPIVNSCKKANLLISNILRKLIDLNETSLAHRLTISHNSLLMKKTKLKKLYLE